MKTKTIKFDYYLEIEDGEQVLRVTAVATPPSKGARDSLLGVPGAGPQLEPDDPGGIEITSVVDAATGLEIDFDDLKAALVERAYEILAEMDE